MSSDTRTHSHSLPSGLLTISDQASEVGNQAAAKADQVSVDQTGKTVDQHAAVSKWEERGRARGGKRVGLERKGQSADTV